AGSFRLDGVPSGGRRRQTPPGPEYTALLQRTSGTTSKPKLVPLTQANLAASAANIASLLQLGPQDTCLNIMPLFHIHGLVGALLSSFCAGAAVAAMPGFAPMRFFQWLDKSRPTWYSAVPTMHQAILQRSARNAARLARTRLRLVRSSSAALPPSVLADLESVFGCPVVESYGMTEAAHQMTSNPLPPDERKPGTVGSAAGPQVDVMDGDGNSLPVGSTGEIVIRGANVMAGYLHNPQANVSAFHGRWFRTGDQGFCDRDGYFTITGRLKELINRGGEKISPREIDEALLEHPAIAQAAAFAVPHPVLGEQVGVAVVLEDGADLTQRALGTFAAERLAAHKVPRVVRFVESIPKGPSGKLKRVGLAKELGLG
ncbi:MAG: AMP-binding protein, partial [Bryobacterales bacterium]|nr:AMP-binding protein [Bryobacterales bacterium]